MSVATQEQFSMGQLVLFRAERCEQCKHDANGECEIYKKLIGSHQASLFRPAEISVDGNGVVSCSAFTESAA